MKESMSNCCQSGHKNQVAVLTSINNQIVLFERGLDIGDLDDAQQCLVATPRRFRFSDFLFLVVNLGSTQNALWLVQVSRRNTRTTTKTISAGCRRSNLAVSYLTNPPKIEVITTMKMKVESPMIAAATTSRMRQEDKRWGDGLEKTGAAAPTAPTTTKKTNDLLPKNTRTTTQRSSSPRNITRMDSFDRLAMKENNRAFMQAGAGAAAAIALKPTADEEAVEQQQQGKAAMNGGGCVGSRSPPARRTIHPSRSGQKLMRQVSGLGMEDPVFGTVEHLLVDQHPSNIFDDMALTDIPQDMRDMVSIASDPTAAKDRGLDTSKFEASLVDMYKSISDFSLMELSLAPTKGSRISQVSSKGTQQQQQQQEPQQPLDDSLVIEPKGEEQAGKNKNKKSLSSRSLTLSEAFASPADPPPPAIVVPPASSSPSAPSNLKKRTNRARGNNSPSKKKNQQQQQQQKRKTRPQSFTTGSSSRTPEKHDNLMMEAAMAAKADGQTACSEKLIVEALNASGRTSLGSSSHHSMSLDSNNPQEEEQQQPRQQQKKKQQQPQQQQQSLSHSRSTPKTLSTAGRPRGETPPPSQRNKNSTSSNKGNNNRSSSQKRTVAGFSQSLTEFASNTLPISSLRKSSQRVSQSSHSHKRQLGRHRHARQRWSPLRAQQQQKHAQQEQQEAPRPPQQEQQQQQQQQESCAGVTEMAAVDSSINNKRSRAPAPAAVAPYQMEKPPNAVSAKQRTMPQLSTLFSVGPTPPTPTSSNIKTKMSPPTTKTPISSTSHRPSRRGRSNLTTHGTTTTTRTAPSVTGPSGIHKTPIMSNKSIGGGGGAGTGTSQQTMSAASSLFTSTYTTPPRGATSVNHMLTSVKQ